MMYRLGMAIWWVALACGALLVGMSLMVGVNANDMLTTTGIAALIVAAGRLARYVLSGD